MKRSSYMIGIAVIMLAAAFAIPGIFAEDTDATGDNVSFSSGGVTITKNKAGLTALPAFEDVFPDQDATGFLGWAVGEGPTLAAGSAVTPKGGEIYVAKFIEYTVTFEKAAGLGTEGHEEIAPVKERVNSVITLPVENNDLKVADKLFIGWTIKDTQTIIAPGSEYKIVQNITLVATYNDGYDVTFVAGDTSTMKKSLSLKGAADAVIVSVPTKVGYSFAGWYDAADKMAFTAEGKATIPAYEFTKNTVLTAKFVPNNMTVTFVVGEFSSTQTVLYGQCAMAPALPEGYVAWLDAGGKVFDFKSPIVADVTITAQAYVAPESPAYKMTFVVDTTTVAETSTADVKIPADPAKTGFEFMGWAVDGTVVDMETYEVVADTVFTAQFKELIFTVQFLNKDGSTFQAAQTVKYGQTVTMPASSFIGWQIKVVTVIDAVLDEDGNVVTESSEVISYSDYNFATPVTGDLDLYGEEAVVEPGFFETPTGKCVIIIAAFIIGFMLYKAYPTVIAPKLKAKGGKKE